MQIPRPHPRATESEVRGGVRILRITGSLGALMHTKVLEPLFQTKAKQKNNKAKLDRASIFREKGKAIQSTSKDRGGGTSSGGRVQA